MAPSLPLIPLEVPVFSSTASQAVLTLGASRIELSGPGTYAAGGLTPRPADLPASAPTSPVPFRIMIRPRGSPPPSSLGSGGEQDFIYTDAEIAAMRGSIVEFQRSGLLNPQRGDGFVFGVVRSSSEAGDGVVVDEERCRELVALARPYGCTFHRAFDDILDSAGPGRHIQALQSVIDCDFDAILTSGGKGNAIENQETLRSVIGAARGRIQIIVGGGVRSSNVRALAASILPSSSGDCPKHSGQVWFHSSCLTATSRDLEEPDEGELVSMAQELQSFGEV